MTSKFMDVRVAGVRTLTPRVTEYLLAAADGRPLPRYEPGAHVALHMVSGTRGPIVRHYSLIGGLEGDDDPRNVYRIAVQREDRARGSAFIHETFRAGTCLRITPPVNNFPLDRRDASTLLVAGGIGVTPIVSMARSLARRRCDYRVVFAGRSPAQMAYRETLARLAGDRVRFHYSDEQGELDLRALLSAQPALTRVYICGPAPMIAAVHAAGAALGWEPDRVRSELFTAGPMGDEAAFEVELRRSAKVVQVSADASILDALRLAEVPVLWDCARGECGLCPLPVIESDGPIEHRDRYLSEEERAKGGSLCICVSRIRGSRLVLDA
ncbi:Toluene-4-sulfonate monooxygenase system reductase subunit TsaB1 [Pigmentiphaga humi]|uniref:Toluene-4-sulfonate monooxygenase system reductase subunit TsaB1 n=1 Tax=Pigmentiphaga humi TaxID=2478468 RepID=A0A3P4B0D2_9BURK|nr:PDR/VanB family oxidoreductase [Pigmentiphaga humi]VCU69301.1 Toluene-4-sulfonate monooxygenase system reductase subunit TsaB1 [Pigmentiphaga humi]